MLAEDMEQNNPGDQLFSRTAHFVLKNFQVVDPNNDVTSACLGQLMNYNGLISNFKWKKKSKQCGGHKGKPHGQLQGKVQGVNRTARAAVYPRTMCQSMCKDIIGYLNDTHQLHLLAWPRSLQHVWHSHFYKCQRCQLGRQAPPGVEHSLLPGECRHARYPTEDGKRPGKTPILSPNPLA